MAHSQHTTKVFDSNLQELTRAIAEMGGLARSEVMANLNVTAQEVSRGRDLKCLEEDASFKVQKVQFLLDATLGLINLAQNDIIKLFSVLAVIFMPPTVIASIYGRTSRKCRNSNGTGAIRSRSS
jgi:Mg2+ and Co2+ transporter CorA